MKALLQRAGRRCCTDLRMILCRANCLSTNCPARQIIGHVPSGWSLRWVETRFFLIPPEVVCSSMLSRQLPKVQRLGTARNGVAARMYHATRPLFVAFHRCERIDWRFLLARCRLSPNPGNPVLVCGRQLQWTGRSPFIRGTPPSFLRVQVFCVRDVYAKKERVPTPYSGLH
jgi:hypothetical protein